jgi:hypothetical protein
MTHHGPIHREFWHRWVRFWIAPGDPTTMAFLRIITGCLVLYVHLAFSFDLIGFFGKNAWVDLDTANRMRREEPTTFPSWGWSHTEAVSSAVLPDGEAERRAVVSWIRSLPTDKAELRRSLALLDAYGVFDQNAQPKYPPTGLILDMPQMAVLYALELSPDPQIRKNSLAAVANKALRDNRTNLAGAKEAIPEVFDLMDETPRKLFTEEIEAFYRTLPTGDAKLADRRAIGEYLRWLTPNLRNNLLKFLDDNTNPGVSAEERDANIDYLNYWGRERRYADRLGKPTFSIWFHVTEPWEMRIAHGVILVIVVMFTVGLFTRITSVLTWLAAISYLNRNTQILFGQDTMSNILLIYLMIANSGATLSLDRVIARYRAVRTSLKRSGRIDEPTAAFLQAPPPSPSSHFAMRMLQVHFCFIYMAAGLSKLKGGTWWNAEAIWQTMVNPEFTMIHFQWYQDLIRWVFSSRPVYSVVAAGGVVFTLFTEIALPFLVWTRLRPWIVICGYLLHFGVGVFMGLLVFSLFMMTMLTCYLPGSVIRERLFGAPPTDAERVKRPVNVTNDTDCKRAAWAMAWDTRGRIELVPQSR